MPRVTVSNRAKTSPYSPVRKLFVPATRARQRGITVYNLNIGEPDLPTPAPFFSALRKFSPRTVAYAPSAGFPEALEAWQRYYHDTGVRLTTDEMVITSGGSEAILFAFSTVADAGDEIITFEPLYPNFITIATIVGVNLVPITLCAQRRFKLPTASIIERAITRRTKAILVCNPSNPTGAVLSSREMRLIADIAHRHGLFILADETYREITFTSPAQSFINMHSVKDHVILIDSASKRFNVCGARVGCIASHNATIIETALKFAQARLSTPSIEQLAIIPLLRTSRALTKPFVAAYRARIDAATSALRNIPGVSFVRPAGTFYLMVTLPVDDTEHFCRWLLDSFSYRRSTVLLAPGSGFYLTPDHGSHEVRIACVIEPKKIVRAIEALGHAITEYQKLT